MSVFAERFREEEKAKGSRKRRAWRRLDIDLVPRFFGASRKATTPLGRRFNRIVAAAWRSPCTAWLHMA